MENLKPLENEDNQEEVQVAEEKKPMPFGIIGISFLCNITQYAVFLGISVAILAIIRIFGPK